MSTTRSEWLIRFVGLSQGEHVFEYEIGDSFFENREGSLVTKANVHATVILHKSGAMQLEISLKGTLQAECVRCLDNLEIPVDAHYNLLVRQVEHPNHEDDDEDAIHIGVTASDIDLEPQLYDFLSLQVPLNPVHADNADGEPSCTGEVTKLIQRPEPPASEEDGRWDALKNLKMN